MCILKQIQKPYITIWDGDKVIFCRYIYNWEIVKTKIRPLTEREKLHIRN